MNPIAMLTELLQAVPARYRKPLYLLSLAACLALIVLPHVGVTMILGLAIAKITVAALAVSGVLHGLAAGNVTPTDSGADGMGAGLDQEDDVEYTDAEVWDPAADGDGS